MRAISRPFFAAVLILFAAWALGGCSNHGPAIIEKADSGSNEPDTGHAAHGVYHDHGHQHADHDTHGHPGDHSDHGHEGSEHRHGGHHHAEAAPQGKIKVGDKVPDFSVQTLDGKTLTLAAMLKNAQQSGNGPLVLSFWCSTCHSCRDVEPLVAKLHADYGGRAAVYALDANFNEQADGVAAFVKESGLDLPVVLDQAGHTADLFGVKRTTTTVVIDATGVLRYCGQFRQKGGGSAEEALKAVLAGNKVAIPTTAHLG